MENIKPTQRVLDTTQVLALGLDAQQDSLRVADLGCGLLPLLAEFRSLAKACGVRRLEYCGLEKEEGVARDAYEVRKANRFDSIGCVCVGGWLAGWLAGGVCVRREGGAAE